MGDRRRQATGLLRRVRYGLDTIPYPEDVPTEQLARVLADVASLAYKWNKPLSARLIPSKD